MLTKMNQGLADFEQQKENVKKFIEVQMRVVNRSTYGRQQRFAKIQKKEERRKQIIKAYSCKKAIYDNCKMLAPDGAALSNCDRKKAEWYVERNLAKVVNEDPFTV